MTESEIQAALSRFSDEEREAIESERAQLTEMGITREPLRTEMACALAEVLLDLRRQP